MAYTRRQRPWALVYAALVACAALTALPARVGATDARLVAVDDANFEHLVGAASDTLLVAFVTASHCSECRLVEYDALLLAASYANQPKVVVGSVNVTRSPRLATKLGFDSPEAAEEGTPALVLFRAGSSVAERFHGRPGVDVVDAADHTSLVQWVNRHNHGGLPAPVTGVVKLSPTNFRRLTTHPRKNVLVQYYAPWSTKCKRIATSYEAAGWAFDHEKHVVIAKVDATAHSDLAEEAGVRGFPTLKYYVAGTDEVVDFDGVLTGAGIVEWVNQRAGTHRRVGGGLAATAGRVAEIDALIRRFIVLTYDEQTAIHEEVLKLASSLPLEQQEDSKLYTDLMRGAKNSGDASGFLHKERRRVQAKLAECPHGQGLYSFYRRRLNVLTVLAPAPLDVDLRGAEVVTLDHDTFDRVVDGSRFVMVQFTAPWCPRCRRLLPEYQRVATEFEGTDAVVVTSLDGDQHTEIAAAHRVEEFPTFLFFPKLATAPGAATGDNAGEAPPVVGHVYSGEPTADAMIAFIAGHIGAVSTRSAGEL